MKALSIKQPWAGLILLGQKPVENRTWMSGYVGPLLIHAGKESVSHDMIDEEIVEMTGLWKMDLDELAMFSTGAVVGIAWKEACFRACRETKIDSVWYDDGAVYWPLKHAAPVGRFGSHPLKSLYVDLCPASTKTCTGRRCDSGAGRSRRRIGRSANYRRSRIRSGGCWGCTTLSFF